jgi:polysaccharide export outer membrane protein
MEELKSRAVRVSAEGLIFLSSLGQIQVAGLTEEHLREQIRDRLLKFMHEPHVSIFVREYQSRQVAVLGAVARPGLYGLTSKADTLFSMITKAGGITTGADPRIHLLPAEPVESDKAKMIVSTLPDRILRQDPSPLILKRTEPIVIDLKELAHGGSQKYLSLPVRPGDVIMVPGGGQVLVEGWVEKPGAYSVSPGLTVVGVVVAAGGPLFPADTSAVKVIRTERGGSKKSLFVDLEKIKAGKQQDIVLQGGDIVEVSSAPEKLTLYGLYRFFTTVVNIGIGGNIPIFR